MPLNFKYKNPIEAIQWTNLLRSNTPFPTSVTSSTAETHALGLLRDLVYSINGKWPLKKEMKHVKIDLQK